MREQIFKTTDIIGYSTDSGSVIDTTLHNVLTTLNFMPDGISDNLCVGYEHESDGIDIYEIYNNTTGEVYWNKNNPNWDDGIAKKELLSLFSFLGNVNNITINGRSKLLNILYK